MMSTLGLALAVMTMTMLGALTLFIVSGQNDSRGNPRG